MILFTLDANPAARTCTLGQQRSRRGGTTAHSTIRNITIDAYLEHPRRTTYPNRGITAWPTHLAARPSARSMWNASCHALPTPASHGLAGLGPTCPGLAKAWLAWLAWLAGLAGLPAGLGWAWLPGPALKGVWSRKRATANVLGAQLPGRVPQIRSYLQAPVAPVVGPFQQPALAPSDFRAAGCWRFHESTPR